MNDKSRFLSLVFRETLEIQRPPKQAPDYQEPKKRKPTFSEPCHVGFRNCRGLKRTFCAKPEPGSPWHFGVLNVCLHDLHAYQHV